MTTQINTIPIVLLIVFGSMMHSAQENAYVTNDNDHFYFQRSISILFFVCIAARLIGKKMRLISLLSLRFTLNSTLFITAGQYHSCALEYSGVKCWGINNLGQLGYGDQNDRGDELSEMGDNLLEIDLGSTFVPLQIVTVREHSCALSTSHAVKCWGLNGYGQLGYGDTNNRGDASDEMGDNLPEIELGSKFIPRHIATGGYHTCALSTTNTVKCFGSNIYGQLGYGDTNYRGIASGEMGDSLPEIELGSTFIPTHIATGHWHTCLLSTNHTVKCFGFNSNGQLGYGDTFTRGYAPNQMGDDLPAIDLGSNFKPAHIVSGHSHTCALSTQGKTKCWGWNLHGQLGYGDKNNREDASNVLEIDLGSNFIANQIIPSNYFSCALSTTGQAKCFGNNANGNLGYSDTNRRGDEADEMGDNLPEIDFGSNFTPKQIATGYYHACAVSTINEVKCWGYNFYGQLGYGDTNYRGDGAGEMGDNLLPLGLGSFTTRTPTSIETTPSPSKNPSASPSKNPSTGPSNDPSSRPTNDPSTGPSDQPSAGPSNQPSTGPSNQPSTGPSNDPSSVRSTADFTGSPSSDPTNYHSNNPSMDPEYTPGPTTKRLHAQIPNNRPSLYTPTSSPVSNESIGSTNPNKASAEDAVIPETEVDFTLISIVVASVLCVLMSLIAMIYCVMKKTTFLKQSSVLSTHVHSGRNSDQQPPETQRITSQTIEFAITPGRDVAVVELQQGFELNQNDNPREEDGANEESEGEEEIITGYNTLGEGDAGYPSQPPPPPPAQPMNEIDSMDFVHAAVEDEIIMGDDETDMGGTVQ